MMRFQLKRLTKIQDERYKKAFKTSFISLIAQVTQMLTAVVSVPLVLNGVGQERYGLWMTLSTTLSFITFTDFGMGIGMQNTMSYATAKNNKMQLRQSFTSTFIVCFFLSFIIISLAQFVVPFLNVKSWFKYSDPQIALEILPSTKMAIIVVAIGLLGGLVQRAFDAFQEGFYPKIISIAARALSLILLFFAVYSNQSLPVFIFIMNGIPNILLLGGLIILYWKYPVLRFSFKDFNIVQLNRILRIGIIGLGATVSFFLINSITPFIISSSFGLNESASFLVLMRLLNFILLFFNMAFLPFWPAVTDAYSKQDINWLKKLYKKSIKTMILIGVPVFLILLISTKSLIFFWTKNETVIPPFNIVGIGILFTALSVWNTISCTFLNGMSHFRSQAVWGTLIAVLSILFAILFRKTIGVSGVFGIITIGMFIRCIVLTTDLKNRLKVI